jgi:hypothetical protein
LVRVRADHALAAAPALTSPAPGVGDCAVPRDRAACGGAVFGAAATPTPTTPVAASAESSKFRC